MKELSQMIVRVVNQKNCRIYYNNNKEYTCWLLLPVHDTQLLGLSEFPGIYRYAFVLVRWLLAGSSMVGVNNTKQPSWVLSTQHHSHSPDWWEGLEIETPSKIILWSFIDSSFVFCFVFIFYYKPIRRNYISLSSGSHSRKLPCLG